MSYFLQFNVVCINAANRAAGESHYNSQHSNSIHIQLNHSIQVHDLSCQHEFNICGLNQTRAWTEIGSIPSMVSLITTG
jgi:hypothetical protein